ncbi:nucleotide exchange factor GrpE [Candidatus Thorarchaeota archaeon]|nr:MAG: nucleotide exchange factor GrpE [Candidatus Thorarchaeota archaeon]
MQENNESPRTDSSEEEPTDVDLEAEAGEDESDEELKEVQQRAHELLEKLMRVQAECDNYRQRMNERFSEASQYASEGILLKVLDVYDNLERALDVDFEENPDAARKGIEAIDKQMQKLFEQEGVRQIESLDKPFDAYYHHSVGKVANPEKPDGTIVDVYQKGYMIRDKVLRPALVCVNRQETAGDKGDNDKEAPEDEGE